MNNARIITATRRIAFGIGLAVGLAACSQAAPQTEAINPTPATIIVEAPTTVPGNDGSTSATVDSAPVDKEPVAPTKVTVPVVPVLCTYDEQPPAAWMYASEALNVRTGPGVSYKAFDHLQAGEYTEWAFYADNGGCLRIPGNGVWWAIWLEDQGTIGWAHSGYLVPELADWHGPENEVDDYHVDCVWLGDGSCIEVVRDSYGSVVDVLSLVDDSQLTWTQLACVYRGDGSACDVLSYFGFGFDTNYGLGNSLTMTPSEDLLDACSHYDGGNNASIAIMCEELESREGE